MHRVLILAISALLLAAPLAGQNLASVGRLYQQGQLSVRSLIAEFEREISGT